MKSVFSSLFLFLSLLGECLPGKQAWLTTYILSNNQRLHGWPYLGDAVHPIVTVLTMTDELSSEQMVCFFLLSSNHFQVFFLSPSKRSIQPSQKPTMSLNPSVASSIRSTNLQPTSSHLSKSVASCDAAPESGCSLAVHMPFLFLKVELQDISVILSP